MRCSDLPPEDGRTQFLYARLRREVAARTGIALRADQDYLVKSRIAPLMRERDIADLSDFLSRFERGEDAGLIREAIDAMTTNETSFFRDRPAFDTLRDRVLTEIIAARAGEKRLRIWCAACSTGQEAYSLAMTLDQLSSALRGWHVSILATDLSMSALEAARKGVYSQFEAQRGLATHNLLRYFQRDEGAWRVSEPLRAMVQFRQFNLLDGFGELGRFDVIFCRNVLMYFDADARRDVLWRLSGALRPDGYLFLGSAESPGDTGAPIEQAAPEGVYRLRAAERPKLRLA